MPGTGRCSLVFKLHPMGAGEVITLQFGGFANFVGAHYWNIQARLYTVHSPPTLYCIPWHPVIACPLNGLVWAVQDELAGLAEQDAHRGVADQVDSNVLFRQGEDARVSGRAAARCYQQAGSTADGLACNRGTWRTHRASCSLTAPAPWAVRCTTRALRSAPHPAPPRPALTPSPCTSHPARLFCFKG